MPFKWLSRIPLRSGLYLLGGSAGVLLVILFGLRPMYASIARLNEEIVVVRDRLSQQQQLAPLYHEVGKQLMREDSAILPISKRTELNAEQVGEISLAFQKMARECGLEAASVTPDAKSLTRDRRFMPMNLTLKGEFLRLRKFLLMMENLPYLERTEEIQIQETSGTKEFRIRIWVAISSQKSK